MRGILADVNTRGPVEDLVREMQTPDWAEFWKELGLVLLHFEDVGLTDTATDQEIWLKCQQEELILITDNRNSDAPDSLAATIQLQNTIHSLPVFTIADLDRFRKSRDYAERVVARLYEYLLQMTASAAPAGCFCPEWRAPCPTHSRKAVLCRHARPR